MPNAMREVITIYEVHRLPSSKNGNARFALYTDRGERKTAVDSDCVQDVKNILNSLPIRRRLTINARGNVTRIDEA